VPGLPASASSSLSASVGSPPYSGYRGQGRSRFSAREAPGRYPRSIKYERKVYVYRPGDTVQVLDDPGTLSGGPVLPGFVLDLKPVWKPGF
jgi:hypothetical protein